jgi:hypothetical protein
MPLEGVNNSGAARIEQVRVERRTEDTRLEEQRRQDDDAREAQARGSLTEEGQDGRLDITA